MTEFMLEKRSLNALIISIVLAVLGYMSFSFWSGGEEVLTALAMIDTRGVVIILGLSLINYGLRFVRWQVYLKVLGHHIPEYPSAMIYLAGFSLTTTPGKSGELLRGVFLKAWGVSFKSSTAAFLSERLSDLVAIILLAVLASTIYPQGLIILVIGLSVVLVVKCFIVFADSLKMIFDRAASKFNKRLFILIENLFSMLANARACHSLKIMSFSTFISVIAWSAEGYAFFLVLDWMGAETGLYFALSVYALSMLAGAVTFLPGGLGGAEIVMVSLLLWSGLPQPEAVAATILIRLVTLWFAVLLGLGVLTLKRSTLIFS